VGPIEAELLEKGALDEPDAHAVVGLVLGAFGELSASCYSLYTSIARVAAARLLSFWKMSPEQALAFSKKKLLAFGGSPGSGVGLASSWTVSTTSFCHPAIPRAVRSTRARSRTNTTVSSLQKMGTALPLLPASAGATAAKVLVCFVYYFIC
jgi:hypothetical protein